MYGERRVPDMSETILYIIAASFYTISLELFILFIMISFQALPGKFFFFQKKNCARIFVMTSLFTGLAGGYICYFADGHLEFFQFWTAFFPALFVPFLLMGYFGGSVTEPDMTVLHMKAGTYTLDAKVTRVGTQITAVNYAFWGNKIVRFTGAVPSSSVSIRAYCRKDGKGTYVCTGYEVEEKAEPAKEEKAERFHSMVLIAAAFFIPLPTTPMFLWYKKFGRGDNPWMVMMVMSLMIVVSGGCRKLFKNGRNKLSKIHYFIFNVMYYIVIITCFVQVLMKIEEMMVRS